LLAVVGVLAMAALLAAIPFLRRPQAEALLARTLMNGESLRHRLLVGFRFIAVVPVLTLLPLLAVISTVTVRDAQLPQVERLADSIAGSVPRLVEGRVNGINALAGHIMAAGHIDHTSLREALLRHHMSSQDFASLWIARPTGEVVVATAIRNGRAVRWSGPAAGVAMMDSFKRAVIAGDQYVSQVEKGATANGAPTIFVSAPIALDGDARWGFVQGLLNLGAIAGEFVGQGAADSVSAVITDQRSRVLFASPGLALAPLSDLSAHPLVTAAIDATGRVYDFSGTLNADGDVVRYVAVDRALDNGWHVFATATQAPADLTLLIYMTLGLLWALLATVLARALAPLYAAVIEKPLKKLEESLDVFDAERTISIIPPPPADAPAEIRQTYARVRESMRQSRDAYRKMVLAVNEGAELRKQLRDVTGDDSDYLKGAGRPATSARPAGPPELELAQEPRTPDATWVGRIDSVTQLSGLDVFDGFFGEAWGLGITDGRPVSVALVHVGVTDDETLKLIGQKMNDEVGRTLDLVARIGAWEFGMILPDTDLDGGLAVADKMRTVLKAAVTGRSVAVCFGVASIVPSTNGNAQSFLDICHRALVAARREGDGQIAYMNDKGKLSVHSRSDTVDRVAREKASA